MTTRAESQRINEQILECLRSDHPQTVRSVYYRMTAGNEVNVPKTSNGYQGIVKRVSAMRREGCLPWSWIRDETRVRKGRRDRGGWDQDDVGRVEVFGRDPLQIDLWQDAAERPQLWVESGGMASVIAERVADSLGVEVLPCIGQPSISMLHDVAEGIEHERTTRILILTDYDYRGVDVIESAIRRDLQRWVHSSVHLEFERVAVTEDQIVEYDLPSHEASYEQRKRWSGSEYQDIAYEADGFKMSDLCAVVRDRLVEMLPEGALIKREQLMRKWKAEVSEIDYYGDQLEEEIEAIGGIRKAVAVLAEANGNDGFQVFE